MVKFSVWLHQGEGTEKGLHNYTRSHTHDGAVHYIKENMCGEQSQADDQQFSFVKHSKGIQKKNGESQATHSSSKDRGNCLTTRGNNLAKDTRPLRKKRKGARNNYFSPFLSKAEHSVYFPLLFCLLMSPECGMSFRQIAPML